MKILMRDNFIIPTRWRIKMRKTKNNKNNKFEKIIFKKFSRQNFCESVLKIKLIVFVCGGFWNFMPTKFFDEFVDSANFWFLLNFLTTFRNLKFQWKQKFCYKI